jgi:hypothetical protein
MFENAARPTNTASQNAAFQISIVFVKQPNKFSDAAQSVPAVASCVFLRRTHLLPQLGISLSQRFIRAKTVGNYWDTEIVDGHVFILAPSTVYTSSAEVCFSENGSEPFSMVLKCHSSLILINFLDPVRISP